MLECTDCGKVLNFNHAYKIEPQTSKIPLWIDAEFCTIFHYYFVVCLKCPYCSAESTHNTVSAEDVISDRKEQEESQAINLYFGSNVRINGERKKRYCPLYDRRRVWSGHSAKKRAETEEEEIKTKKMHIG